jgi:hypothetical protein
LADADVADVVQKTFVQNGKQLRIFSQLGDEGGGAIATL